jgi:large subunit ribosomal protein L4
MRGGGIIFGPEPRDYTQNIPQQKRRLALQMALSVKAKAGSILVLESLNLTDAKTKTVAELLKNLKVDSEKVLLVVDKTDANLKLASRNIQDFVVAEEKNLNTYQVMWARKVIYTSAAVNQVIGRTADK